MLGELSERIDCLNREQGLQISLETIAQIYGEDIVERLAEMADDTIANIDYLLGLGFGEDVSDICNRYGILLCEDHYYFCERVGQLVDSVGADYTNKMGEDMSWWESLM